MSYIDIIIGCVLVYIAYTLFYRPNVGRRKSYPANPVAHFLSIRNRVWGVFLSFALKKSNCINMKICIT